MTEKLKTLMHERATSVDFESPDLDALTRDGDRALRRHRSVVALGGVAAAAAVVVGGVALLPGGDQAADRDVARGPDAGAAPLTWVTGSTLHVEGSPDVDLGHRVSTYVRTSEGFVFADRDGVVWSRVGGRSDEVGRIDLEARDLKLISDDSGSLAAWVDDSRDQPAFVVLDQTDGSVDRYGAQVSGQLAVYALDAGTAYWRDPRGLIATDVGDGTQKVLSAPGGLDVIDVESETYAATDGQGSVVGTQPGRGVALPEAYGSVGTLSPDGRYYSSEGDEQSVFDTETGDRVRLDLTQRFAVGYEWLGGRTLAVLAAEQPAESATAQLLTCTVPEGRCTLVAEDLGTFDEISGRFALPVGE